MPRQSAYDEGTNRAADAIRTLVIDFFRGRQAEHAYAPAEGSVAARHSLEARGLPGVAGLPDDPIREMWQLAATALFAAEDHVLALADLLQSEQSILGHAVAARSVIEAAGRVFWLLDPGISVPDRVSRSLGYMWEGLEHLEALVTPLLGAAPNDPRALAIRLRLAHERDDLLTAADDLGVRTQSRKGSEWAGTRPPGRRRLVVDVLTAAGQPYGDAFYNYLSGVAHGDVRRLVMYLRPADPADSGAPSGTSSSSWAQPTMELGEVLNVTRRAVDALVYAERLYWSYLGWQEVLAIDAAAAGAVAAMQP
ncbi:MAG: hypothetical protein QOK43_1844 [Acidimicrobiaceae bacterium]|nr:hypothetical protein [Acidimicrobiaceae bacterium]